MASSIVASAGYHRPPHVQVTVALSSSRRSRYLVNHSTPHRIQSLSIRCKYFPSVLTHDRTPDSALTKSPDSTSRAYSSQRASQPSLQSNNSQPQSQSQSNSNSNEHYYPRIRTRSSDSSFTHYHSIPSPSDHRNLVHRNTTNPIFPTSIRNIHYDNHHRQSTTPQPKVANNSSNVDNQNRRTSSSLIPDTAAPPQPLPRPNSTSPNVNRSLYDQINDHTLHASVFVPGNVGSLPNLFAIVREAERRYGTIAEFRCPTVPYVSANAISAADSALVSAAYFSSSIAWLRYTFFLACLKAFILPSAVQVFIS